MTTDINTILSYDTVSLTPFEIRGTRSGVNNARTTGIVYTDGIYEPADSSVGGSGLFSSDTTVSNFVFDPPYGSLNTSSLKVGDSLTVNTETFSIVNIETVNRFQINPAASFSGSVPFSLALDQREYVVEPDVITNTKTGVATFTSGVVNVTGSGFLSLAEGDFIKYDGYQDYIRIAQVYSDVSLDLVSGYPGATVTGPYTAKKWKIGLTRIQYAKNDITYDGQAAKWKYDNIVGNDLTTSTSFMPLADGIELAFSRALNSEVPDLMDVAVTNNQTFASETQYETSQFSLPVVPFPEASMELFIDDVKKTMYEDYVLTYTQSPVYEPPPPPDKRFVANVMFLDGVDNVQPIPGYTESGQFFLIDSDEATIAGVYEDSISLTVDSTSQLALRDFMVESNAGILEVTDSIVDEDLVKYVSKDLSEYIDYGFSVYLNGKKQNISFPASPDDDILFQPASGRLKPRDQDHPGPGEVYQVNYMVETTSVSGETKAGIAGSTVLELDRYPVKQDSIFLAKNNSFLEEGVDFFVSYLTGRIILSEPSLGSDVFKTSYVPLSKQVNDLTYESGKWYCTTRDSRLTVQDAGNFKFLIANVALDVSKIEILRIYNETRDLDYNLTGLSTDGSAILLEKNAANIAVGLDINDVVVIDYTFLQRGTPGNYVEYFPVIINTLNVEEGSEAVYFEGSDLTSLISSNSIMTIAFTTAASESYHNVTGASYDGFGTRIDIEPAVPEDVVNPKISISDGPPSYLTVPATADPMITGNSQMIFSGINIRNIFRPKTQLSVGSNFYQVSGSAYDSAENKTTVSLSSEITSDQTSSSVLSSILYSDNPIYYEGDTVLVPSQSAVTLFNQPAFILNNDSDNILSVSSSLTELIIDGTAFSYANSSTLGDLSGAIDSSNIDSLSLITYAPTWQSNKIIPVTDVSVYRDSSTVLSAYDALRYAGTDTSSFSVSEVGNVILENGLQNGDKYTFDYLGRQFLGDNQVEYSLRYFVNLPEKSKVAASFQYINLDQFYIQVLSQKDFLEKVTIPRMEQESLQLSGSVGQGGTLPNDDGATNDDAGLTGDEYARRDAEIECNVFKNVYDFFQGRLENYGIELEAAIGYSLFNNDGTFSDAEQNGAAKAVSRVFPTADYTSLEPMRVNPLTGYFFDSNAVFTNGSTNVSGSGTKWLSQLNTGGYIGPVDSTRRYLISNVNNNTSVTINPAFEESTVSGEYTATNNRYPIYDDDGFLGAKIVGSKADNYGIEDGETFNITIDGTGESYTFNFPSGPFLGPFFANPDGPTIASLLSDIDGLSCSYERVLDPATTYGYRNSLVMRTTAPSNLLEMSDGTTTVKLGFSGDQTASGNLDRNDSNPEIFLNYSERIAIAAEEGYLAIPLGFPDKLDRTGYDGTDAVDSARSMMVEEHDYIIQEIDRLEKQITATGNLLAESGVDSTGTATAHANALYALTDASSALADVEPILLDWEGKVNNWKWSLDFTEENQTITGIDGSPSFILSVPSADDRRILNAVIFLNLYTPVIVGDDDSIPIVGTWSPWSVNGYSLNNTVTFDIDVTPAITLTATAVVTNLRFVTDSLGVNIHWLVGAIPFQETYTYVSYPTVGTMKAALNTSAVVSAAGNPSYDSRGSGIFQYSTTLINPTADLLPGLRDSYVTYQTISDKLLNERLAFIGTRDNYLLYRGAYLDVTRESQIYNDIKSEGLLLNVGSGEPGNIYAWANNRFNRRQGCYARLKQIEQQIASNQSALQVNQSLL